MVKVLLFIISFISSFIISESARILAVFPTPSISHQIVFRPLTQELARRGHKVIVLTTDPAFPKGEAPNNVTEIDVHDMSYDQWKKNFYKLATGKQKDLEAQVKVLYSTVRAVFDEQLKTSEMKKIIDQKQHFDLLLLESWVRPTLVLSHIFKVPVIKISSFARLWYDYENIGAPVHPFLYPSCYHKRLYNLTLWEKLSRLYGEFMFSFIMNNIEKDNDNWIKNTFGNGTPSLNELSNNVDMLFLNIHPIWEGNVPVPQTVVHTWGLHLKPEQPLPLDLKTYLDSSKNGVIYMSFGTNSDPANLPPDTIQMFIRVFSKLPYKILWKWNQDVLPGKSDNIRISKWFPQPDLLRHPNIKLFITQGGQQSTDEAIVAGVPLIGIPMLGDQWYNTEKYVHHGIGIKMDIETVTELQLREAIDEIIANKRYRVNIKKLGELMLDQPAPALERAVWWVEHVLRHGGARHLRAPAANISWGHYYEIELLAIILLAVFTVVCLVILTLYYLYTFIKINVFYNIKLKQY